MSSILLGNAISFVGALFLFASCLAKTKRRVIIIQFFQCVVLTVAQIVFGKGAGAVSMSVAGLRNLIIASGHYNFIIMLLLSLFTLVFGIYFNTGGVIGLLPIASGIFYTVSLYYAKNVRTLKISLSILLFVWIIYSAMIFDLFGTVSNTVAQILNLITLSKLCRDEKIAKM